MEQTYGWHNENIDVSRARLIRGETYRDLSTIWVTPTRGAIPAKIVQNWMNVQTPMNQKFTRVFMENMEVADAYNQAIECIMNNNELKKWRYVLTVEEDNMPPSDGLLKLYEGMKKFDVVSGLYWTKGEGGQPMIYGDPKVMPKNFLPQVPQFDTQQECNGLGMGFTLFKLSIFKKMPKPWFRTLQENGKVCTQDLFFFNEAASHGYKFACDTRVKVGHYDQNTGMVW